MVCGRLDTMSVVASKTTAVVDTGTVVSQNHHGAVLFVSIVMMVDAVSMVTRVYSAVVDACPVVAQNYVCELIDGQIEMINFVLKNKCKKSIINNSCSAETNDAIKFYVKV